MQHSETETTTSAAAHLAETSVPSIGAATKLRIMGVDVARGLALLGMVVVHVYGYDPSADSTPSMAYVVAAGKSVVLFALLAGVSLALLTGGRHPMEGRSRIAAAAGLAVRALLIGFIGLVLGSINSVNVILVYYGVLFLLAIPLIGLRPRVLACLAIVIALVVPVFTLLIGNSIANVALDNSPTFDSFLQPYQLAVGLFITGTYAVLPFMAYICAGLAIGRLELSSTRVAVRLLGAGLALAAIAWVTSEVLLLHLGGLQHLRDAAPPGTAPNQLIDTALLWSPPRIWSWWWLAVNAPYSATPINLLHTMGVAMAALGAMLLLTRVAAPVLRPVAAAGSMVLTLYSAHVVYMAFDPLEDYPFISYVVQVTAALVFAVIWQRVIGQGPLEAVIAFITGGTRNAVGARIAAEGQRQEQKT
jgi:uncharacterized membrane protein YeiB